jgi:DNA polymerase II small subunit/DNA polymerase delta subunit B
MYIGNDLIESISLDLEKIPKPGYVGSIKRCLKMKYRELIQQYPEPPDFLVIDPVPKVSQPGNQHKNI